MILMPADETPPPAPPAPPVEPDFDLPEVMAHQRWFRWFLVVVVLAVIAGFAAKPAYRAVKQRRAERLLAETETALEAKRYADVAKSLRLLQSLTPGHPRMLRIGARLCTETRQAAGLTYWNLLASVEPLSLDDYLQYLELAILYRRTDVAGQQLGAILKTNATDPRVLRLGVALLRTKPDLAGAARLARQWLAVRPEDAEAQFRLGDLLVRLTNAPPGQAEGRRLLLALAAGSGPWRDAAASSLVNDPGQTRAENENVLRLLGDRPGTETLRAELQLKLNPDARPVIVSNLVTRLRADTNDVRLARGVAWLAERQQLDAILALLSPERVKGRPRLLTARLQALLENNRENEALAVLDTGDPDLEKHLEHCLRAYSALRRNRPQEVSGHFDNAIQASTNEPIKLSFIAKYAERTGQAASALSAAQHLLRFPATQVEAGRMVLRLATQLDNLQAARDAARDLADILPGDGSVQILALYLDLLLEKTLSAGRRAELEELVKARNGPALGWAAVALARLRAGDAVSALEVFDQHPELAKADVRTRAVYTAVLGENRQREAARSVGRGIDLAELRTAERELVEPWIR